MSKTENKNPMTISTEMVKELRDQTGVSIMQCKKALEEAGGSMEKAIVILRKLSSGIAAKKGDRTFKAGTIQAYIHANGTVGTILELNCETDFVANNDEFKALARKLAAYWAEWVRLDQPFVKNPEVTIQGLLDAAMQKFGEKTAVGRFARYKILER